MPDLPSGGGELKTKTPEDIVSFATIQSWKAHLRMLINRGKAGETVNKPEYRKLLWEDSPRVLSEVSVLNEHDKELIKLDVNNDLKDCNDEEAATLLLKNFINAALDNSVGTVDQDFWEKFRMKFAYMVSDKAFKGVKGDPSLPAKHAYIRDKVRFALGKGDEFIKVMEDIRLEKFIGTMKQLPHVKFEIGLRCKLYNMYDYFEATGVAPNVELFHDDPYKITGVKIRNTLLSGETEEKASGNPLLIGLEKGMPAQVYERKGKKYKLDDEMNIIE